MVHNSYEGELVILPEAGYRMKLHALLGVHVDVAR
jgi:hypothetical protein